MTAEIAIMNKAAVSLAADSAVTIGRGASAKIYNSVNKIFELHENAPVGVMVYGSLTFMGFPIETILKQYRKSRCGKNFGKIADYRDDLISYLEEDTQVGQEDERDAVFTLLYDLMSTINNDINRRIFQRIRDKRKYLKSKDNETASEVVREQLNVTRSLNYLSGFSKKDSVKLEQKYSDIINAAIEKYVDQLTLNASNRQSLRKLASEAICREHLSSYRSGIVIAGFGDDEICPSLEHFEVDGVVGGRLRLIRRRSIDISKRGTQAEALGFAQSDMIDRFLHGSDPEMREYSENLIRQSIEQTAKEIIAAIKGVNASSVSLPVSFNQIIANMQEDQIKNLDNFKNSEYTRPIKDMITHMPKTEMATLAKSLIDLTSLKRKVSREQESVGGEVDVAVISKSEGFVWVSRKHYFPKEINARFFARHFREKGGTE